MHKPSPQRALVTGATGFLGSHLLTHLQTAGWETAALVRSPLSGGRAGAQPRCRTYEYHGETEEVVRAVCEFQPDVVFHLASLFLVSHKSTDIASLVTTNILLGTQLLEAIMSARCGALVNVGTGWQNYGHKGYDPVNLYAATKQAFEDIVSYYVEAGGLHAVTLRLHDTYGPHDRRRKLVRLLLDCLRTGAPLSLSPGEQVIDLVHVDDVCRALLHGARLVQQQSGASVYGISGGERRTLREVAATLEEAAGQKLPLQFGALPYRTREVMEPWTGPALPGWAARIPLLEGFRALIDSEGLCGPVSWREQAARRSMPLPSSLDSSTPA